MTTELLKRNELRETGERRSHDSDNPMVIGAFEPGWHLLPEASLSTVTLA